MKLNLRITAIWLVILAAVSYLLSHFFQLDYWTVFAFFIILSCLNIVMADRRDKFLN